MKEEVNLIECFRSFQGEGPDSGRSMYILRFKTCNLNCSWCDTAVKMRISVEAPYKLLAIQELLRRNRSGILVTGGEPTVPRHMDETKLLLNTLNYPIANVESNGFNLEELMKDVSNANNIHYMYSPKIFKDEDVEDVIKKTTKLLPYPDLYVKIVYENKPYIHEYLEWLSLNTKHFNSKKVWLMPEGVTRTDLIRNSEEVFDMCEKYKFNFSSRSHIIYGFV